MREYTIRDHQDNNPRCLEEARKEAFEYARFHNKATLIFPKIVTDLAADQLYSILARVGQLALAIYIDDRGDEAVDLVQVELPNKGPHDVVGKNLCRLDPNIDPDIADYLAASPSIISQLIRSITALLSENKDSDKVRDQRDAAWKALEEVKLRDNQRTEEFAKHAASIEALKHSLETQKQQALQDYTKHLDKLRKDAILDCIDRAMTIVKDPETKRRLRVALEAL